MTRHFLVGAALLLSATTAGLAITAAAGEIGFSTAPRDAPSATFGTVGRSERPVLLASESREHSRRSDRLAERDRHHDDEDEDDDDDRGMIPQNGPANPSAPVPDNGLFNDNSRPKVQVQ